MRTTERTVFLRRVLCLALSLAIFSGEPLILAQEIGPTPTEAPFIPPPEVRPTQPPPDAAPASDAPDPNAPTLETETTDAEVWREQSVLPQVPPRLQSQFKEAYITGEEPVVIQLQFSPLAAGKMLTVRPGEGAIILRPGDGATIAPPYTEFVIAQNGECVFLVNLEAGYRRSHITVICDGVHIPLPLIRATLTKVVEKENETGGAQ